MVSPNPTAFPLAWPPGWPRTPRPLPGPYRTTLHGALTNLQREVKLLGGSSLVLSSNVTLGADKPRDVGVVAYFTWDGSQVAIPCDRWHTVQQNVQAIALTIESMRAIERHGAKHMVKSMFQGFVALPAPMPGWRELLGNPATLAEAEEAYRAAARRAHPDNGGSSDQMAALNAARDEARRVLT